MKKCNECGIERTNDSFSDDKRNKDGLQGICRDCYKKRKMERYYNDPEYRKEFLQRQALKKKQRKLDAIDYKGGNCFDCGGVFHPSVYEFHHLDPSQKDYNLAHKKSSSWEKFKQELDKCVLLCANCHRIRHWKENENH